MLDSLSLSDGIAWHGSIPSPRRRPHERTHVGRTACPLSRPGHALATGTARANTIAQNSAWTSPVRAPPRLPRRGLRRLHLRRLHRRHRTRTARRPLRDGRVLCRRSPASDVQVIRRCQSGAVAQRHLQPHPLTTDRAFMQDASTRIVTFEMCGNDYLQARSSFGSATGTCNYTGPEQRASTTARTSRSSRCTDINTFAHAEHEAEDGLEPLLSGLQRRQRASAPAPMW